MKRTQKEIKKQTEEWLDERYMIINMNIPPRQADVSYYKGALEAICLLGYSWKRNEDGKHIIF